MGQADLLSCHSPPIRFGVQGACPGLEPVEISKDGSFSLMATYVSLGKTAKFRVEFGPAKTMDATAAKDFPMKTGEGRFVAEAGSDASVLLLDLKKALEAKVNPSNVQRLNSLPFTY
jgi:hypothetical protein